MLSRSLWSVAMVGMLCSGLAQAAGDQPVMARGWIVKLKESQPQPVVRLAAAAVPSDGPTSQRNRLWQATQRQRVSMLAHKPTAFGANVVHAGRLLPLAEAEAEAQRLRQDPDVEWVVVNQIERDLSSGVSPETVFSANAPQQWLQSRIAAGAGVADFPAAWSALSTSGRLMYPVVVAVLDTGILAHPDVNDRVIRGYDFVSSDWYSRDSDGTDPDPDDEGDGLTQAERDSDPSGIRYPLSCTPRASSWHGFSIAHMLGAANSALSNPGVGMLAPMPNARVLAVRVAGVCGADVSDIVEGILWSAGIPYQSSPPANLNPARVLSLSFGGNGSCDASDAGQVSALYRMAITALATKGAVLVAAAGNGAKRENGQTIGLSGPTRPASCEGALAVTGLGYDGAKERYANLLGSTDPGAGTLGRWGVAVVSQNIVALSNSGQSPDWIRPSATFLPALLTGTSFATPQAAGVAAMALALNPGLSSRELLAHITGQARAFPSPLPVVCNPGSDATLGECSCTTTTCGSGVLDAGAVVQAVLNDLPLGEPTTFTAAPVTSDFVPDRAQSSGGGGGGHIGWPWGLALYALLLSGWWSQRRRAQNLQAVNV